MERMGYDAVNLGAREAGLDREALVIGAWRSRLRCFFNLLEQTQ